MLLFIRAWCFLVALLPPLLPMTLSMAIFNPEEPGQGAMMSPSLTESIWSNCSAWRAKEVVIFLIRANRDDWFGNLLMRECDWYSRLGLVLWIGCGGLPRGDGLHHFPSNYYNLGDFSLPIKPRMQRYHIFLH